MDDKTQVKQKQKLDINHFPNSFLSKEGYSADIEWHTHKAQQCACGSVKLEKSEIHILYDRCSTCGTYVLTQLIDEDQLSILYGKCYWYEHQLAIGLPNIEQRYYNDLYDRVPIWVEKVESIVKAPATVLEIGCAHGGLLQKLAQRGYVCEGVEYDDQIINIAKKLSGVVVHKDLPDKKYSLIIANDVLEHIYQPVEFMKLLSTRLLPGGKIFTQIPMVENEVNLEKSFRPYFHTFIFSKRCAGIIAEKSGLEVKSITYGLFGTFDVVWAGLKNRDMHSYNVSTTNKDIRCRTYADNNMGIIHRIKLHLLGTYNKITNYIKR